MPHFFVILACIAVLVGVVWLCYWFITQAGIPQPIKAIIIFIGGLFVLGLIYYFVTTGHLPAP
jgi:hypothetical protein